jgi:2-oxoglutarate dehydrogenase E2 component (dihydrolipoamide succinyltransferase)
MATEITVPALGESITEGTVARWLRKEGEAVRPQEPLFELETDKATAEVAASVGGILHITVPEGTTVPIGTVVGHIDSSGKPLPAPGVSPTKADGATKSPAPPKTTAPAKPAEPVNPPGEVLFSPAARRLAEEEGIDIRQVKGTGPDARVTKEDVLKQLEQRPKQPPPPARPAEPAAPSPVQVEPRGPGDVKTQRESRQRLSTIRLRIAERLVAAQNTGAILTTFNEADLSAVLDLRSRYKDAFREKHGVGLGFMSFFVKAALEGLQAYPVLNAWIDGNDVVHHHYYSIGVAVSTERGLVVPVVRDADQLSFAGIEQRIAQLAQRAREGKITVDDLQGGTFTITNGGVFGSLLSTPILNPPQSGILGMHAIQRRPVAVNDQVLIRPMMYLALSYDHRLVDGRDAVLFLTRIKECIEQPEKMLLQI